MNNGTGVKVLAFLLLALFNLPVWGQQNDAVTVVLEAGGHNVEAPQFENFKPDLEAALKKLLMNDSMKVLKFNHDSTAMRLANCNLLTCLYKITYAPGRMLNANIECALSFTDCHKKEVLTVSTKQMTGAVAGMKNYLRLFEKLITPELLQQLKNRP
jgi:hypothetical protein